MIKILCVLILSLALCQSADAKPKKDKKLRPPPPPPPSEPPPAPGEQPAGYILEWGDEFDSLSLGIAGERWAHYWTGWNTRALDGNSDDAFKARDEESWNGGATVGQSLRATGLWGDRDRYLHEVLDGKLVLRGYPTPLSDRDTTFFGMPYTAGMISGQESFARRYGYWETRVYLKSVTKGQHFAIWLASADNDWPPEIDMLEVVGQNQDSMFTNSHGETPALDMSVHNVASISDAWHTIAFQWTPTLMQWTIDGEIVRSHPNFITAQNLYFLMSWEMTNNWTGSTDSSTVWPAEVLVDYVRIYRPE